MMSAFPFAPLRSASITLSPVTSALAAVRSQAAFLRSLLDEVERLAPAAAVEAGLTDQIVEELARLGHRSLEAASALRVVVERSRRCA